MPQAQPTRRQTIENAMHTLSTPSKKDDRKAGLHVPGKALAHLQKLTPDQQRTAAQLLQAFHRAPTTEAKAQILQHVHQTLGESPQAFMTMHHALVKDGVLT